MNLILRHCSRRIFIALACVICVACSNSADITTDHAQRSNVPTTDYVGQEPPGSSPRLFAPNFISTGMYERDVAITPDRNEFYFGLISGGNVTIAVTKREEGLWSKPEIAPFCTDPDFYNLEPHIRPDGKRLLFLSTRPKEGQERKPGWVNQDIWAVDRIADGWSEPYNLGPPVNSDAPEYYPSTTRDGTIYFTREVQEEGKERSLIMRARLTSGKYAKPEALPKEVNPGDQQYNAFVDPDERYLIVCMSGREDAIGRSDYYICFRNPDDSWVGPINMGDRINTPGNSAPSSYVSPDGRYFFFASTRKSPNDTIATKLSYENILRISTLPENGNSDIYWMDASFIDSLRP
jgi:hypothetical protein